MTEEEALQVIFIASRVINRAQYGVNVPGAEADALRRLADTDSERTLPLDELARKVIERLIRGPLAAPRRRQHAAAKAASS
jgi:hypothetical protein